MSVWFDTSKQKWCIRIRRSNKEVRRTLPAGTTSEQASAMHDELFKHHIDSHIKSIASVNNAKNDVISAEKHLLSEWKEAVHQAASDRDSWLCRAIYSSSSRSKKSGKEHTLTKDELLEICLRSKGRCEVTGLRFENGGRGRGKKNAFQPSVDRIDSTKGYTKDNVRLVCWAVNAAMGQYGEEVIKKIAYGLVLKEYGIKALRR